MNGVVIMKLMENNDYIEKTMVFVDVALLKFDLIFSRIEQNNLFDDNYLCLLEDIQSNFIQYINDIKTCIDCDYKNVVINNH